MVSPSRFAVEKKKKNKIMAIAKLFALHANAIIIFIAGIFRKLIKEKLNCLNCHEMKAGKS